MSNAAKWILLVALTEGSSVLSAAPDLRLIDAAKRGDVAAVQAALAGKVDVNAAEPDGSTALHWAARRGDAEIVRFLIKAGANVRAATRFKITPLSLAATNGNAEIIARLLEAGADANDTSQEGQTALMSATLSGDVASIKLLIGRGAHVNTKEPYKGQTAMMWAASEGHTAAVKLLVEAGADLSAKSSAGWTTFLFAVRNDRIETANALLDLGAHVNDAAPDGTSALNMAIVNAYFDLASQLLDRGANPNAPDPRGSALHTLAWLRKPGADGAAGVGNTPHGPPPPSGRTTTLDLATKLLDRGANPNVRIAWEEKKFDKEGGTMKNPPLIQLGRHYLTYVGATPFYVAAHNGDAPYMRLLAEHGADPKLPNVLGITPLIAASGLDYWEGEAPGPFTGCSEAERLAAVRLALDLGNDINVHADFGAYVMDGDPKYLLLYYPLNMEQLMGKVMGDPRWSGVTALHASVVSGQVGIVKYLIERGADVNARSAIGWTPLMLAEGVFFANAKKEYPAAAAALRAASSPPAAR